MPRVRKLTAIAALLTGCADADFGGSSAPAKDPGPKPAAPIAAPGPTAASRSM